MTRTLVLFAIAALALPGSAIAKELKSVGVCGVDACRDVGQGQSQQFIGIFMDPPDMPGGRTGDIAKVSSVRDPVALRPYYRVDLTMGAGRGRTFSAAFWYVRPNLFRPIGENGALVDPFRRISAPFVRLIARTADDLEAFPAPRVVNATIDGKRISQPEQLVELFSGKQMDWAANPGGQTASLRLEPNRQNPWFAADTELAYLPGAHLVLLDNPVQVGDDVASVLAEEGGFAPVGDGEFDWVLPVGLGVLAFSMLAAGAIYFVRIRRRPGTATA